MKCTKCKIEFNGKHRLCDYCYNRFIESEPRDYTLLVNIDTPKDIRRKFDIGDVFLNLIKCNKCWDVIRSKNRHDYVMCKCKNCGVDWWSFYCKRIGNDYTELSQSFTDVIK